MPKFSIIIPVCGNEKLTRECLASVSENSSDHEIIIVDNGSTPPLDYFSKIIHNEKNLGFPIAVNQGIKAATGEVIIVLNNDTIVTPGWLEKFETHLQNYDIVGPVSNSVSGSQQISYDGSSALSDIYSFSEQLSGNKKGAIFPWHRLVFFCAAIKRSVIDKIGLLDEQFSPGNFEDDDFCLRAIEAGFKLGIAEDVFIYHIGSVTHKSENIDFQNLMATNLAKFQAKWPEWKYQRLQKKCLENFDLSIGGKKHSLALVMIVKNEEKGLARAIESCRDFVDEVVVSVDSASTDKTEEIARAYADVVKVYHWKDDFSAARNFAHEGVKSDWILFLDGHEYVKKSPNLAEHLALDCDALLCTVEMENGFQFRNPRIYKNGVQFVGAYHEMQKNQKTLLYIEFLVKHDRLGGQDLTAALERNAQREDMMPRIMGEQIKKDPKNRHALFHLSLFWYGQGQYKKAIKLFNKTLKLSPFKGERWYVFFNRALCQMALKRCFRAYWSISRADDETPDRWESFKLKGLILFQRGKFAKAAEAFVDSFKINTGDQTYKPWSRDDAGTWNLIGECFFNLGQYFEAHVAFSEASKRVKDYKFKYLWKKRAQLMLTIAKRFSA